MSDPYFRLKAPPPPADDEYCACADAPPLVLQGRLAPNPLACLACNGEVRPESVPVPLDIVDDVASWRDLHDSLYNLWLDSGEFEAWARDQLTSSASPVHGRALALIAKLTPHRSTYDWWFTDDRAKAGQPPLPACPRCRGELTAHARTRICTLCHIVVSP